MERHRKFNRLDKRGLVVLCGIFLLFINACSFFTKTKTEVAPKTETQLLIQNYFEAVHQKNLEKARSFLTNCNDVACFPELPMTLTQALIEKDRWKIKEIKSESIETRKAEIDTVLTDKNGKDFPVKFELSRLGGQGEWKIFDASID